MDISNEKKKKKQDAKYFDEIENKCFNKKVGEAFYWLCMDYYEKKCKTFNEQKDRPDTEMGQELKLKSLHSVFEYIKSKYVLRNLAMNIRLKIFCDDYHAYCEKQKKKCVGKIELRRILDDAGIKIVVGSGHNNMIKIEKEELLTIYQRNKWLHILDEFQNHLDTSVEDSEDELGVIKTEIKPVVAEEPKVVSSIIPIDQDLIQLHQELRTKYTKALSEIDFNFSHASKKSPPRKITRKITRNIEAIDINELKNKFN